MTVVPRRLFPAAVVAAAVGAALLAGEVALRLAPSGKLIDLDIYRKVDGLLLLRPGLERRHATPLWDVRIRTNAEGFRDVAWPSSPGDPVVVGLGDSFAFGWGVELEQTLYSRLEDELSIRLLKAGVPGTGPSDYARVLERLLSDADPSGVALTFFVGNDFSDVRRGGSVQHGVEAGFLTRATPPDSLYGKLKLLAIHSRVLQLVRFASFRLLEAGSPERVWDDRMREFAEVHLSRPPQRTKRAIEMTLSSLDDVKRRCDAVGIPLLLIVLPRSYQIYPGELAEMLEALQWEREDLDLDRPQRLLLEWAATRGVAAVDILPGFRAHAEGGGDPLFYTPDAHMTAAGHALAAQLALDPLARMLE